MTSSFHKYQRIAPYYDLLDWPFEFGRYRRLRPLMVTNLSGRVLEAGVGTGRNLPYYPAGTDIIGIDLSPAMLMRARRRRNSAHVELREMDVTRLDFSDRSFDAVVASFLFCVLPDEVQPKALSELGRVVKAGGMIRLLEYVRPRNPIRRAIAGIWEPWMRWAFNAGFDRHTESHAAAVGLTVTESRFVVDDLIRMIEIRIPG